MAKRGQIDWTENLVGILKQVCQEFDNWDERTEKFKQYVEQSNVIYSENKELIRTKLTKNILRAKWSKLPKEVVLEDDSFEWNTESRNILIRFYNDTPKCGLTVEEQWVEIRRKFLNSYPNYKNKTITLKKYFDSQIKPNYPEEEMPVIWDSELISLLSDLTEEVKTDYNEINSKAKMEIYEKVWDKFIAVTSMDASFESVKRKIQVLKLIERTEFGVKSEQITNPSVDELQLSQIQEMNQILSESNQGQSTSTEQIEVDPSYDFDFNQQNITLTEIVEPCPSEECMFSQIENLSQMSIDSEVNIIVEDIVTGVLQEENVSAEKCESSQETDFSPIEDLSQMIFDAELKNTVENIVTEVLRGENDSTENVVPNRSASLERMSTGSNSDEFDTEFDEIVSGMTFETPVTHAEDEDSFGSDGSFGQKLSEIPNEELIHPSYPKDSK